MVSTRYALRWERGGAWRGVLGGIRRRGRPGDQGRIKPRSCPDSKVGAYRGFYKYLSLPIVFVNHETDTGNAGFFLHESAYSALERVRFLGHQVRGECPPYARKMKRHVKRLKMAAARVRSYREGMWDLTRAQIRILGPREEEEAQRADRQRSPGGLRCREVRSSQGPLRMLPNQPWSWARGASSARSGFSPTCASWACSRRGLRDREGGAVERVQAHRALLQ